MNASELLDAIRVEIKLGSYGVAPATALYDSGLHLRAQEYRRQASARLYPLDRDLINQRLGAAKFHVSRKLDGEFNLMVYRDQQVICVNPGGTVRCGLPWQDEAAEILGKAGISEAIVAGELYARHDDGRRSRVHDIVTLARGPKSQDDLNRICFGAFDVVGWNGEGPTGDFFEQFCLLEQTFSAGDRVHVVPSSVVEESKKVEELFRDWVEAEGAEGLVVRSEAAGSFKIKPRHNLDVAVVGFTESTGDRAGMLHDLLIALRRGDGTYHILGRVGGGFSDQERRDILADLKDSVVASEYAEVNSDKVAYRMVAPEWVIEISCLDLISQTTRGGPVNRMALDYDGHAEPQYRVVRRLPLAALISPQFIRKREDKTTSVHDVSIDQVSRQVELPMADRDAKALQLAKSEVLQREVYCKELKGQTMVRKFVLWQTNKEEQASEDYPAYVLHYTDFSPNRKTPLSREIRVSDSREQIESFWNQFKKDYIKSGWQPASGATETTSEESSSAEPLVVAASGEEPALSKKKATKKDAESTTLGSKSDTKKPAAKKPAKKKPAKKKAVKKLAASAKPKKKKAKKSG